ncbi:MAG: acetyl-CoA hydrolase/transferase family protein [Christensenellales bacterium]|jgi:4-hydroxybutyrate CoA-transferase
MNWQQYYKERLLTAQEAVTKVKSGDRVVIGHACGEPTALVDAMIANKDAYENVEIVHLVGMGKSDYTKPGMEKHFRLNSLFLGANDRQGVAEGRADYTPIYFYRVPILFRNGSFPIDVSIVQVSPPDKQGYCSLGVSADYTAAAVKQGKIVIAQVNPKMPRCHGDCFVHVTDMDWFVELERDIVSLPPGPITAVEEAIGGHCASLVENGSTLQLGIGSLPDAVVMFLKDKKDLGIHSEMISDSVVDLMEVGIVNNKRKTLHPGKAVVTFLMGTRKLYDYVDDNPSFHMAPVDYVNDPYVIAQNYKMISINSCVQVDIMGQVCSESVGKRQISGPGGQVDYVRGACMCPGGKAIIAMPSTARGGKLSKIVPVLDEGAAVTTNRYDVHYIVTEYGIADLRDITLRERARRLIAIAHPDFRPQLIDEYEQRYKMKF